MKKIEITDSLRKTKLNNAKREQFADSIMIDVFKKRSDVIRAKAVKWQEKIVAETWGSSPQARAANKKALHAIELFHKKIKAKGLFYGKSGYSNGDNLKSGHNDTDTSINMAGMSIYTFFKDKLSVSAVIDFQSEFLASTRTDEVKLVVKHLGSTGLTLKQGHKLIAEFEDLNHESDQLRDASVEFRLMVGGILKKSTTIGAALQNWPELEKYLDSIMSKSREVIVKPEDLTAKLNAIKSGVDIKDAMKSTGGDATRVKAKK